MISANACIGVDAINGFSFWQAGVGVHSTTKLYFKKYENIPLNIYRIFYFEIVGKAYKNKIQMLCTKSSVWESHVIGHSCGVMKNGILLYTLAVQTCLLMFFFSLQNKTISILNCVNINIICTMHSRNIWNIPLYKHRKKVKAVNLGMEISNRYSYQTPLLPVLSHKITF